MTLYPLLQGIPPLFSSLIVKRWSPDMDLEVEEMPVTAEPPASPCAPENLEHGLQDEMAADQRRPKFAEQPVA